MNERYSELGANADWPLFGWVEDVRPARAIALRAGRDVALATLYKVEGGSPRGPGVQMLFDAGAAFGYFPAARFTYSLRASRQIARRRMS
jgi:xanthine/CO dehydrogenase XdhC/CoxF family maturation factor